MSESAEFELLLRRALAPIDPPADLSERLEATLANLTELAAHMELSKSAINHRLRRLLEIADGEGPEVATGQGGANGRLDRSA